jgi:cyclophilin family peptidyl-prolyl cis-trans isomerase
MYRQLFAAESCAPLIEATRDANAHVRLAALDALGTRCPERRDVSTLLAALVSGAEVRSGRAPADAWHERAHALVALVRADSTAAVPLLARAARDAIWQMRLYAARAAGVTKSVTPLLALARDSIGSVREAAIESLVAAAGRGGDDEYVAALSSPDAHVVLAAANALAGTPARPSVVEALLGALDRLSRERRETSRDPRVAILRRLQEVADTAVARRLAPYARDFDPVVATQAAALLSRLTRRAVRASPERLPIAAPLPDGILTAGPVRLRITMAARHGGGTIVMRLDPRTAPASVARILALARRGYYNGLTWHRVAPNFVVQGGSPAMNEYVGDGPFMRDELGLASHLRGTVGISTRGRDTGDAQLFINLVDNFRLDHDYTVVAEVETGMDVVDAILEGDVMERVEVVPG